MNCTIRVAKTKALIRCAVTAQLICGFVFAHAKIRVSHDAAQITYSTLYYFFLSLFHSFFVLTWS